MKYLFLIITVFFFCTGAYAKSTSTTFQIIFDDSGVVVDASDADRYKLVLLAHIRQLTRKREYANAQIDVISSSLGRTIWSGTPSDLKRKPARAQRLVESIKTKSDHCNNLPASFMELESNIEELARRGFIHAHVIVFSSLIHTSNPCEEIKEIILPQSPPVQGNINAALTSSSIVRSLTFYWVSPHQKHVWKEFLKPTLDWAVLGNIPMLLLDIERSKSSLELGLGFELGEGK